MADEKRFVIYTWEEGRMLDDVEYEDEQFNKYYYHDYGNALQDFENKKVDEQDSGEYPLCIIGKREDNQWYVVHHVEVSRLIARTGLTKVEVLEGKEPFREDTHINKEQFEHTATELRKAWQEGRRSQAELDEQREATKKKQRQSVHDTVKFLLDSEDRIQSIVKTGQQNTEDVMEIGDARRHSFVRGTTVTLTIEM